MAVAHVCFCSYQHQRALPMPDCICLSSCLRLKPWGGATYSERSITPHYSSRATRDHCWSSTATTLHFQQPGTLEYVAIATTLKYKLPGTYFMTYIATTLKTQLPGTSAIETRVERVEKIWQDVLPRVGSRVQVQPSKSDRLRKIEKRTQCGFARACK